MRSAIEIRIGRPIRDLAGRFNKAEKKLLQIRREMIRPEAMRLTNLTQDEAPKRSGKFAEGIQYRTFVQGNEVGFTISTPQPLGKFIIGGTEAHPIVAKQARSLRFFWPDGPRGPGEYFYVSVNHPGTAANRFHGRAYRRWLPGARQTLNRIGLRYAGELQ